jgi:hypothetical protein
VARARAAFFEFERELDGDCGRCFQEARAKEQQRSRDSKRPTAEEPKEQLGKVDVTLRRVAKEDASRMYEAKLKAVLDKRTADEARWSQKAEEQRRALGAARQLQQKEAAARKAAVAQVQELKRRNAELTREAEAERNAKAQAEASPKAGENARYGGT